MNYIISIEGQTIPVPEEIGATDEGVKRALAPFYPEAANAMITRTEKDGTVTVTVVKRAGSKGGPTPNPDLTPDRPTPSPSLKGGGQAVEYLAGCADGKNPAVLLYEELQTTGQTADVEALLELDARLAVALVEGKAQNEAVEKALRRLVAALPRQAPDVVIGF